MGEYDGSLGAGGYYLSLTPSVESYESCAAEAAVLTALHWQEMYGKQGYRANHGGMVDLEKAGGFAYFTLRDTDGKLCGHAGFMVLNSPFYGMLIAIDVFYFVLPEHRGGLGICKLLRLAGEHMTKCGIRRIMASHHVGSDLHPILERAGYVMSASMFTFRSK